MQRNMKIKGDSKKEHDAATAGHEKKRRKKKSNLYQLFILRRCDPPKT